MKISRGKNTVIMNQNTNYLLADCLTVLSNLSNETPIMCQQLVINNLIPKFLVLDLKSSEAEVKSELMIHNPSKFMTIIL